MKVIQVVTALAASLCNTISEECWAQGDIILHSAAYLEPSTHLTHTQTDYKNRNRNQSTTAIMLGDALSEAHTQLQKKWNELTAIDGADKIKISHALKVTTSKRVSFVSIIHGGKKMIRYGNLFINR